MSNSIYDKVVQPSTSYMLKEGLFGFWGTSPSMLPDNYPELSNKTALITGISAGVGREVAKLLASKNCTVIGVVRNMPKARAVVDKIYQELGSEHGEIKLVQCDLADMKTIVPAAKKIASLTKEINYIIHNAGVMSSITDTKTIQGLDLHFGTNCVGPQYLQEQIDPIFLNTPGEKRIVWCSSAAHFFGPLEGMYWANPSLYKAKKVNDWKVVYGHSKSICIYQAQAYGDLHPEVTSVSCYPGVLATELQRDQGFGLYLGRIFMKRPIHGANTELYALFSSKVKTGDYVVPFGDVHDPRADIKEGLTNGNAMRAWTVIDEFIKVFELDPNTTELHV